MGCLVVQVSEQGSSSQDIAFLGLCQQISLHPTPSICFWVLPYLPLWDYFYRHKANNKTCMFVCSFICHFRHNTDATCDYFVLVDSLYYPNKNNGLKRLFCLFVIFVISSPKQTTTKHSVFYLEWFDYKRLIIFIAWSRVAITRFFYWASFALAFWYVNHFFFSPSM